MGLAIHKKRLSTEHPQLWLTDPTGLFYLIEIGAALKVSEIQQQILPGDIARTTLKLVGTVHHTAGE